MSYPYEDNIVDLRPQNHRAVPIGSSFQQHDAAVARNQRILNGARNHDRRLEAAGRTLPGEGLTENQWLNQLVDTLTEENSRLMQETLHQRDALQTANHQLRMRTEELERYTTERGQHRKAIDKLLEATGGVMPEYQVQKPFTICVLVDPISERVFTGAACCNQRDQFNETIGKAISLGRAMNQRAEYFAENAYGR